MLTPHFDLDEFVFSSTAQRLGIDNTPPLGLIPAIAKCALGLEQVRDILGQPIRIDSGYRCPMLNKAVGGAANSAHMDGYAADFTTPFGSPLEVVKALVAANMDFDQLIQEGTWTHISFAPSLQRQVLTAHFTAGGTVYTEGV